MGRSLRVSALAILTTLASVAATQAGPDQDVRKYCTNIATAAMDARFSWQTARLNEVDARIKARIKALDEKEAVLRALIDRKQALEKQANEKLVGIYAKMRPETAATQINLLDDDMAAAVLGNLNPRQASSIFNEIVPERAAKLAGMIAGVAPPAPPAVATASAAPPSPEGKKP